MKWQDLNNAQIMALYGTILEGFTLYEEQLPNMSYYFEYSQLVEKDISVILNWYRDSLEYGIDWNFLSDYLDSYDDESFGSMYYIAQESLFRYKYVMDFIKEIEEACKDKGLWVIGLNYGQDIEEWYSYVSGHSPKYKEEFIKWNDLRNSYSMAFYETGYNGIYYYDYDTNTCHFPYSYIYAGCPKMTFYHKYGSSGLSDKDKQKILDWYNDSLSYGIDWKELAYRLFTGEVQMLVEQKAIFKETSFRIKTAIAYQREIDKFQEEQERQEEERQLWYSGERISVEESDLEACDGEYEALGNIY